MNNITDTEYDFSKFINILNQHNILSIVIASAIGDQLNNVVTSFVNSFIMPFFSHKDKRNIKLKHKTIYINGIKFKIGRFILVFVKCIIIIYIIFFISKLLKQKYL